MITKAPIIGVDFGQAADYSAIAFGTVGEGEDPSSGPNQIHIRYLERLRLGMKYEEQITRLKKIYDRVKIDSGRTPLLIVDGTGVGRAVVEMVRKEGMSPIVVTVTGGHNVNKDGFNWNVPKKELVSPLIVGVQNRSVRISNQLDHKSILESEMQAFKLKINIATGNESFEAWRERDHDDLVFAVALVCFGFKSIAEPGVVARTVIPSKYNDGSSYLHKYRL